MSDISFDEDQTIARSAQSAPRDPALVRMVIRWELAKDRKGAELLLVYVAVIAGIAAIAIPFLSISKKAPPPPPPTVLAPL